MKWNKILAIVVMSMAAAGTQAAPLDVFFTTTGSAGNWTYDVTVTNNLGGTNNLYFFGLATPGASSISAPGGWNVWGGGGSWSNAGHGGSSTAYTNNWITDPYGLNTITPGNSGVFKIHDTNASALSSIAWFGFAWGGTYTGSHFYLDHNPGFEGVATNTISAVPVPAAAWLFGSAIVGLFGFNKRRESLVVA